MAGPVRPRVAVCCLLTVLLATAAATATAAAERDVRYRQGAVELAALLLVPDGEAPFPAAVILQGSGTSDRSNQWARAIADELVDAGLAVLLTDKRGSGASGGDWRTVGFDELAADALAGVDYLRALDEVDAARIGLVGLSQGGWVAPVAAARADGLAFVVDVSGAGVSFTEQSFHEMANTVRRAGFSEPQVAEVLALNRAAGEVLAGGDWEEYAGLRQRGLNSDWSDVAAGFPAGQEAPIWTFLRRVADFDPIPYWMLVEPPVLVLYGAEDESDNVPVAESVERLEWAFALARKEDVRIVVVPGAGHAFIDPREHVLLPAFTSELTTWVREHVRAPAPSAR